MITTRVEIRDLRPEHWPEVASIFSGVVGDIHARLIGARSDPVVIGPDLLTAAIGDPRAAALPPVSLVIPEIEQLDTARRNLDRYLATQPGVVGAEMKV